MIGWHSPLNSEKAVVPLHLFLQRALEGWTDARKICHFLLLFSDEWQTCRYPGVYLLLERNFLSEIKYLQNLTGFKLIIRHIF